MQEQFGIGAFRSRHQVMRFDSALRRAGVPFELHVFPEGIHGLSLANELTQTDGNPAQIVPGAQQWMDLCLNWLNRQFR